MAARRASAKCASVLLVLVVMVSGSASARIALPTSDYNNLDTSSHTSEQQLDAPSSALPSAAADAGADGEQSVGEDAGSLLPWTVGAVRMLRRLYLECREDDLSSCLKVQMVRAMDRVARSTRKVALAAGVTLERDADAPEQPADADAGAASDDLEHTLPRSLPERERSLDKLILERLYGFLQNYSLRFKLPSVAELGGAVGEDARRRRPPLNGLMGLGMLLAGSLLPMKFGMLAMLAGKALMLSKLALLISALMAMRNMGSGGGSSGGTAHH
ncbi:putative SufE-like protein [Frankliniella fusca]|uniref:SufE-like protein n=1 Tax=Frankliniella fusca TaxID=407009 RepID=A0AAE1LU84_9NEOP|nr:putative SufE-like protein [Frankliniella fusca]